MSLDQVKKYVGVSFARGQALVHLPYLTEALLAEMLHQLTTMSVAALDLVNKVVGVFMRGGQLRRVMMSLTHCVHAWLRHYDGQRVAPVWPSGRQEFATTHRISARKPCRG